MDRYRDDLEEATATGARLANENALLTSKLETALEHTEELMNQVTQLKVGRTTHHVCVRARACCYCGEVLGSVPCVGCCCCCCSCCDWHPPERTCNEGAILSCAVSGVSTD